MAHLNTAIAPSTLGMISAEGYWPQRLLQAFTLRMAGHGLSVSSCLMICDPRYALDQLSHAHTLADSELRELATELFRRFERERSGIAVASV